jgi:beta-mannosidase
MGALFWMFTDCWGTTGCQGIIDYYLRRNPSFYYVRKAFKPVNVSFREDGEFASIFVVNDTLLDFSGVLDYGISFFSGKEVLRQRISVSIPANTSRKIAEINLPESLEERKNTFCWAKLFSNGKLQDKDRLFMAKFGDLNLPSAVLRYTFEKVNEEVLKIKFSSDHFAWYVNLEGPENVEFSDNWFDVFPGEVVEVIAKGIKVPFDPSNIVISWNNRQ